LKRLYFDRIFHRSYWTWRKHPTVIIPSMLGTAVSVIEQSAATLGIMIFLTVLAAGGLLPSFLSEFTTNTLSVFQDSRFAPGMITIILVVVVIAFLALVVGGGFVLASEYGTYLQAWKEDVATARSLFENGSRRWEAMAWTYLVANAITWGPAILGALPLLLAFLSLPTTPSGAPVFLLLYLLLALVGILTSLILGIFTVYSYPAVMTDDVSGLKAVRGSFHAATHHLGITMTYVVVRGALQLLITLFVMTAGVLFLPLTSLSSAILSLLLNPILHTTKTMIYSYASPSEPEMSFRENTPIWYDIFRHLPRAAWLKVRAGLSEIGRFLFSPGNLPFHLSSTLAFVSGIFLGEYVSNNGIAAYLQGQNYIPGQGNPVLRNTFQRPFLGLDIFLNNWLVSIATALSGIGFGIPSLSTILFNAWIVGLLVPLTPSLTMFLAAILPHGIIEIPSLIIAGSAGTKLGYTAWKLKLSPTEENRELFSSTLRQTVYIVVGLAPLFLIAGLIEGDITPIIMQLAGWRF
jgi:uncharacterized membrane protein SpoIIM required for sporulation